MCQHNHLCLQKILVAKMATCVNTLIFIQNKLAACYYYFSLHIYNELFAVGGLTSFTFCCCCFIVLCTEWTDITGCVVLISSQADGEAEIKTSRFVILNMYDINHKSSI